MKAMLGVCCLCISYALTAQSLVPNGGFENHKPFCGNCVPYNVNRTIDYLNDWKHPGPILAFWYCNTSLPAIQKPEWQFSFCRQPQCDPHNGEGMIALFYIESCPSADMTPTGEMTGCPTYVYATLRSPLIVGNVYEISMWVYFPKNAAVDTTIYKNIGFNLTLKPERLGYHDAIATDYFFGDSIPSDQWYEIKHYIRALCPLKYITLGTFYDEHFPRLHRSIDNQVYYFVDDVKVVEVNEDSLASDIEPTPFCNYYEKKQKITESRQPRETTVYFETASAVLDEGDIELLDSFYAHTSGNTGNLYIVSGHTDNQGSENIALSSQRANGVATYLQEKYKLSPYKFVTFSLGESNPIGDNRTASGRQQNRRVTISNSNIRTSAAVYRIGMEHMHSGDMSSALKAFGIWLNTVPANQRMSILHDPRLNNMKSDPAWRVLVRQVREYYKIYVKPEDAFFLDSMFFVDQRFRTYTPIIITGYIPGLDTFDVRMPDVSLAHLEKTDAINLHTLNNFLKSRPFPIISEVGRHQVRTACLIYIHSLDSIEMGKLLPILESNCLQGEAEWDMYATLFDKLQLVRDRPQEYGTQSILEHGQKRLYKYDDLEAINARRKRIGMYPIMDQ